MELDMTKGSPSRLILKFIVPLIIGNIFQQLYSMVDTIIVGQYVGVQALAAVGATGTINFLILGFMMGMTSGFTVPVAQRFGAGDYKGMRVSIANAARLCVIVTVIMTAVSILGMRPLLHVMNTPEDIFEMSWTYIVIICVGMVCIVLYNFLAGILRAIGNSKVPLFFLIVSAVLNILLDLFFIRVIPLGVAGAALATVISQGISGLLCLFYLMKKVPLVHPKSEEWTSDKDCMGLQLKIGLPMALQFSITAIGTIMVQSVLNLFGSTVIASYTAASKVEALVTQPFGAMGMTMATYGAQNRGINDLSRIRRGVRIANGMSAGYAVIIYVLAVAMMPYLVVLFVSENISEVLVYATIYMKICGAFFIPLGMIFIFRNILQGCGFSFIPMFGGVIELVSRMAAALLAAHFFSYEGICAANISAWLTAGIYLLIGYIVIMRRMLKQAETGTDRMADESVKAGL